MRVFGIADIKLYGFISVVLLLATFTSYGEKYIWIGGSGNWSDTLHWQSENGGLPTIADTVIFNAASFTSDNQVVTIDSVASCHDMDWSGITHTIELTGATSLYISGSILLNPLLINSFSGDIYFESYENGNVIDPSSVPLFSDLYFEGTGSWVLSDSLIAENNSIYLNGGGFITMDHYIRIKSFNSASGGMKVLKLDNSVVEITGSGETWKADEQTTLIEGNSILLFSNPNPAAVNVFTGGNLSYSRVVFKTDGYIKGNNSFDYLVFNAEHTYRIQSGSVQTIEKELYARGCSGLIEIKASGNAQATIAKSGANNHVSFVSLQSIHADFSPGYYFIANHSVDLGNNSGCAIYETSRDMFWVEGSGQWSDTLHWSSSPMNEDADCLPLPFDNVTFNDESFNDLDTVEADIREIQVNHMTWSTVKQPVFKGTAESMTIYGSLQFATQMTNDYGGITYFRDTLSGQTIKTSSVNFNNDIVFDGPTGGWDLVDTLITQGNIYFMKGSLNVSGDYIKCRTFKSDSAFNRSIQLNSAVFEISNSNPYPAWSVNNTNLNLDAGNSSIIFKSVYNSMINSGEDTLRLNDVFFEGIYYIDRIYSKDEVYSIFRKVSFASNGSIIGDNMFDTISMSPGNYYELESGSIQTVNYDIWPTGNCEGPVLLKSSRPGEKAFIEKPEDTLRVNYTAIYDIEALGNAVYIGENSIDLGNSPGWDTVYNTAPGKLYWVGGSGDWEDTQHWSLTSGGPGGECIPTPYDTVIFDQYSFENVDQLVTIHQNNAFAHDMVWTDAQFIPEFAGSNNSSMLRIYGSLYLNPDMKFTFPGYIYFESRDSSEMIVTQGVKFHNINNNVYFMGPGGQWNLTDPLDLGVDESNMNTINLNYGDLYTHDQPITCFNFYSNTGAERVFSPGNSSIRVYNNWLINGTNLDILENASLIMIDSGYFMHRYGNYFPYHDLVLNSYNYPQTVTAINVDSLMFHKVLYHYDGFMHGQNSVVLGEDVLFMKNGQINDPEENNPNVYILDSLRFKGMGEIIGNDTAGWVRFDSTGIINGEGDYMNLKFHQNGDIYGNNIFDTLTLSPGYTYQLEGLSVQHINRKLNITGNNCDPITIVSTDNTKAVIRKYEGLVKGEHLELNNINATGGATFDAGYFSNNINLSNDGWIFHEMPYTYDLGKDINMLEGDTLYICAEFFNGNASTNYQWIWLETGEIVGTDSCLMVTEKGNYLLNVTYNEGSGCMKQDTIYIGCHLALEINKQDITCNGFSDGEIEVDIQVGAEPYTFTWLINGQPFANTQNLYDLPEGMYDYIIKDSIECISKGQVQLTQPDSLKLAYFKTDACYNIPSGTISLVPSGGTEPYQYSWSNDSVSSYISGLAPDIYHVSLSDVNDCPSVDTSIEIIEYPELKFDLTGNDLQCYHDSSGYINIEDLSGGTGNYTDFLWYKDDAQYKMGEDMNSLMAGNYTLVVKDDLGCEGQNEISLTEPDELELELLSTSQFNDLGSIDLTVTGGVEPYSYLWNTGFTTEDIDPLGGGEYTVQVHDAHGCYKTGSLFVDVHYRIFAPNAFSPNGDGINDEFELKGLGTDLTEYRLSIYNRYGQQVFYSESENVNWNGRLNNTGPELPSEVYTWQVELEFIGGKSAWDAGNITLLR